MSVEEGCSHGKSYEEPCWECEIMWQEQSIASFAKIVERSKRKLAYAKQQLEKENGKPTP